MRAIYVSAGMTKSLGTVIEPSVPLSQLLLLSIDPVFKPAFGFTQFLTLLSPPVLQPDFLFAYPGLPFCKLFPLGIHPPMSTTLIIVAPIIAMHHTR
ncbi:MAG: hypothetical protein Kow00105_20280 [Phycisphaeraceae bacterium]